MPRSATLPSTWPTPKKSTPTARCLRAWTWGKAAFASPNPKRWAMPASGKLSSVRWPSGSKTVTSTADVLFQHPHLKRLQVGGDVLAVRLQPCRQHQLLPQRLNGFVDGEAGTVGGDFEQDAAPLPEVDGREVFAVDDGGHVETGRGHPLPPPFWLREAAGPPGNVVHGAGAAAARRYRLAPDVDDLPQVG